MMLLFRVRSLIRFPGSKPVTGIRIFLEIGLSWFYVLPLASTVSLRHFKAELVKISKRNSPATP
jgi:hypothetical protein